MTASRVRLVVEPTGKHWVRRIPVMLASTHPNTCATESRFLGWPNLKNESHARESGLARMGVPKQEVGLDFQGKSGEISGSG